MWINQKAPSQTSIPAKIYAPLQFRSKAAFDLRSSMKEKHKKLFLNPNRAIYICIYGLILYVYIYEYDDDDVVLIIILTVERSMSFMSSAEVSSLMAPPVQSSISTLKTSPVVTSAIGGI